jgi:uncharacterized membrane protein YeaQ/YmgE (transglycosylase-associated protein family)
MDANRVGRCGNRQQHLSRCWPTSQQEEHIMDAQGLVVFLVIGAVAGWLAGLLMKGGGFGLLGNIVVGIVGAVVGGFLFGLLGISAGGGMIGSIVTATLGAIVLLFVVGLIKKA